MKVTHLTRYRGPVIRQILEALPQWFGIREAREDYIRQAKKLDVFICEHKGKPAGFISLKIHNSWNAEIYCMGVLPEFHRQGIGKLLVQSAQSQARASAIRLMSVKTLSSASQDPYYARTRNFYLSCGFEPFEEFPDLWGQDNPCLLMVKSINQMTELGNNL